MGVARKRDVGGYSKLMDKAAKCLHRLFELAPSKKRNYILDQVNKWLTLMTDEWCVNVANCLCKVSFVTSWVMFHSYCSSRFGWVLCAIDEKSFLLGCLISFFNQSNIIRMTGLKKRLHGYVTVRYCSWWRHYSQELPHFNQKWLEESLSRNVSCQRKTVAVEMVQPSKL